MMTGSYRVFCLVLQFPWKLGDLMARNVKEQRKEEYNTLLHCVIQIAGYQWWVQGINMDLSLT